MRRITRVLLLVTFFGGIQGCTSFENILPDREKEYKYSTEIPPLEVPPDLSVSAIEASPIRPLRGGLPSSTETEPGVRQRPYTPEELPEGQAAKPAPDVERSAEGAYISVKEKFPIAWRMVGRALSRLEIEIQDLNRSEGLYYIVFEDRRNRKVDDSIWSRLAFWSDANAAEELKFRVRVDDKSDTTEVRILDEDGAVISEGTGLDLLQMIQDKINEQIAEK